MKIGPSCSIDYEEFNAALLQYYKKNTTFNNTIDKRKINDYITEKFKYIYETNYENLYSTNRTFLFDLCLACMVSQYLYMYKDVKKDDEEKYNLSLIYKTIIHSLQSIRAGIDTNWEISSLVMIRTFLEKSRLFILCNIDQEFRTTYFSGFRDDKEKKNRYYKLTRNTKITDNLIKNFHDSLNEYYQKLNSGNFILADQSTLNEFVFDPRSMLISLCKNNVFYKLHQDLSELTHLTEFDILNKIYASEYDFFEKDNKDNSLEITLFTKINQIGMKYLDLFHEYLCMTILTIYLINVDEGIEFEMIDCRMLEILETAVNEFEKFGFVDIILKELKNKIAEEFGDEISNWRNAESD